MNMKKMFLAIAFLIVAAFNLMAEPQTIVNKCFHNLDKYWYACAITFKEDFAEKKVQIWKDAEVIVTVFDPIEVCMKKIPFAKKGDTIFLCQTIKRETADLDHFESDSYLNNISNNIHSAISTYTDKYYPDYDSYLGGYLIRFYTTYKGK